jgi:hypothetical protein
MTTINDKDSERYRYLRRTIPLSIMVYGFGVAVEEIKDWSDEEIDSKVDLEMTSPENPE